MGALFSGLFLSALYPFEEKVPAIWRWWREPRRALLMRAGAIPSAGAGGAAPGALVKVSGRVVAGAGTASWRLTGHLIVEDASGRRLQIGEGHVRDVFEVDQTVFAIGVLVRPAGTGPTPGADPYRGSAPALDVLVPAPDGAFLVVAGTPERALADLDRALKPRLPPLGLGVAGAAGLLLGLSLLLLR